MDIPIITENVVFIDSTTKEAIGWVNSAVISMNCIDSLIDVKLYISTNDFTSIKTIDCTLMDIEKTEDMLVITVLTTDKKENDG